MGAAGEVMRGTQIVCGSADRIGRHILRCVHRSCGDLCTGMGLGGGRSGWTLYTDPVGICVQEWTSLLGVS